MENNFLSFITDDWKKIPQNYRYLILAGIFLIFNTWLLDHWGTTSPYLFFNIDIRQGGYNIGFLLIILAFTILIMKQFTSFGKLLRYRMRYPPEKLDIDYYLVWFNGKLMLFDVKNKPKKYFHVYPWETAQDLLFVGKGMVVLTGFMPNVITKFPANYEGKMLDLKDFKNGGAINTQI